MFSPIRAEIIKLSGSAPLLLAAVVPLVMGGLAGLATVMPEQVPSWGQLLGSLVVPIWALLVLPSSAALLAALIAQLDHQGGQFDHVLALPLPRWRIFAAKMFVIFVGAMVMTALTALSVLAFPLFAGVVGIRAPAGALPVSDVLMAFARGTAASLALIVLQSWLSIRTRTFLGPTGLGAIGTAGALAVAMSGTDRADWFPWALPFLSVIRTNDVTPVVLGGVLGMLLLPIALYDLAARKRSA